MALLPKPVVIKFPIPQTGTLKVISTVHRDITSGLAPVIAFNKKITALRERIQDLVTPIVVPPFFQASIPNLARSLTPLTELVRCVSESSSSEYFRVLADMQMKAGLLEQAGWLPNGTTPFELLEECDDDPELLRQRIEDFYVEQWPEVRATLEHRIGSYEIDDEAKAAFREALTAHGEGLYRCVCRMVLPEIERVARVEIHGDEMVPITSQRKLRDLAGEAFIDEMDPQGYWSMMLYRRLQDHIYEHVDEKDRPRFAKDSVPNRHAALHGYVSYGTRQNSLNTLFIAAYVFRLVHMWKMRAIVATTKQADQAQPTDC